MSEKHDKKLPASARKLLDMVADYRRRERDPKASLSELSLNVLSDRGDRQVLARWTNPGERSNWFIPLRRVREVAQLLGASEHDADLLMVARLQELDAAGDLTGAVEAVSWALELVERAVSVEQRFILDVLNEARGDWAPEVSLGYMSASAREGLIKHLRELLREVGDELTADVHDEQLTDEESARMRAEGENALKAYRARVAAQQKSRAPPKLRGDKRPTARALRAAAMRRTYRLVREAQAHARRLAGKQ